MLTIWAYTTYAVMREMQILKRARNRNSNQTPRDAREPIYAMRRRGGGGLSELLHARARPGSWMFEDREAVSRHHSVVGRSLILTDLTRSPGPVLTFYSPLTTGHYCSLQLRTTHCYSVLLGTTHYYSLLLTIVLINRPAHHSPPEHSPRR